MSMESAHFMVTSTMSLQEKCKKKYNYVITCEKD